MKKYTVTFGPLTQHGVATVLKKIGTSAPLKLVSGINEPETNSKEPKKRTTGYSRLAKVTDEMKKKMQEMRAEGRSTEVIAIEIGCSRQSVVRYSPPPSPKDLFSRAEL